MLLKRGRVLLTLVLMLAGCTAQQKTEVTQATERAKDEAQHVAQKTQQAVEKTKETLTDGTITAKVKTAMSASDKLNTKGINVDTQDKVVTLKGSVADARQKALAERIAKDTVGPDVKVVNQLQVRPSKPQS